MQAQDREPFRIAPDRERKRAAISSFERTERLAHPSSISRRRRASKLEAWARSPEARSTYPGGVQRAIVGFHQDELGDWVAELDCGHHQHVRHRPPFQLRPWVVEADGRRDRLGTPLECPLCETGGEAACLAQLLCPDCGIVLDGSPHRPGCASRA